MWNLRNKTDEHRRRGEKREKKANDKRLNYREQTEDCWREVGREWAKGVMGIKEDSCWDEHWVL